MDIPPRRTSSRVRVGRSRDVTSTVSVRASRRPVADRWFYEPVLPAVHDSQESSDVLNSPSEPIMDPDAVVLFAALAEDLEMGVLAPVGPDIVSGDRVSVPLTREQKRMMMKRFNVEGRIRRRALRIQLTRDWEMNVAPALDHENDHPDTEVLMDEQVAFDEFMSERLIRHDLDFEAKKEEFLDDLSYPGLPSSIRLDRVPTDNTPDELLLRRTAERWAGLRRV
jgi:hypothetical protein